MSQSEYTFEDILRGLGHIYSPEPYPKESSATFRLRHIVNDSGSLCGADVPTHGDDFLINCEALHRDSNCTACRKLAGLEETSMTKRSLMLESISILMNIETMFLEAIYWNGWVRKTSEEKFNPDPDGLLAANWEEQADQLIKMLERARPTMAKHANTFGWPDELEAN